MFARRPAPRPKRGGEEFSRTHHLDDDGPNKKPRFDVRNPSALAPDAPEEDITLEADEIGKRGQKAKRNAVNIDGYGSDSSNEGFDARANVKAKEAKKKGNIGPGSKQEEEDDMFADLDEGMGDGDEDEEVAGERKKKDKSVRFLEVEEIEGQVLSSTSGGHVSADFTLNGTRHTRQRSHSVSSSSDSDVPEEERADAGQVDLEIGAGGKKFHAPKIDAFNMKSEQEEGRFDASGNYVRKAADPDAVHDSWLEGVSKKDMKKAKEAADKRDEERRQKAVEADAVLTSDILKTLIPYLDRGETVLEALARLGKGKERKKPKWQNKKKNKQGGAMGIDPQTNTSPGASAEDPAETHRREAVEAVTGAADQLLTRGQTEIYDAERELLMRQYKRETGDDWVDVPLQRDDDGDQQAEKEGAMWEYRWSDARDGGETHGPYDGRTMRAWEGAGYFGEGSEFRRAGAEEGWKGIVKFV